MSKVKIQGHASGSGTLTLGAPNTDSDRTITLPDTTGTLLDENSNIPAANITGTLPAISGANLTGVGVDGITSSADATAMTITSAEKIGIGTASPQNFLHIQSGDSANDNYRTGADSPLIVEGTTSAYIQIVANENAPMGIVMADPSDSAVGGIIYDADAYGMRIKCGGSTRMEVAVAGDVKVSSGDLIFGTAGKGVCLGATSNTDANTLDDYEEGTWTPTNNGGSVTITVNEANYTKIGRLVTVQAYLGIGGDGDGTEMRIGGLPFAAHNTTYESAIGRFSTYGDTANVYVSTTSGQTYLWVITKNTFLNENQIDGAGGDWNFSLTYHVN